MLRAASRARQILHARAPGLVEPVDLVPDLDRCADRSASMPSARSTFSTSCNCACVSSCETSRTCRMTSASITSSSVARNAATSMVGRSEMKPTVSDRIALVPCGSSIARKVGSRVANSMSASSTSGARQAVEQRGLAGIGVADQRDDRIRHALAARAMQLAALLDLLELGFDASQMRSSITRRSDFDLRLARAAEKAEAAALALEMRP